MTRAPFKTDRFATLVFAVLLIVVGLALIDWRYHLVFHSYPTRLSLGSLPSWAASGWWPWVFAAVTVVVGLLGVWWLLAHARSDTAKSIKMPQSSEHGTITLDTSSLADAVAQSLEDAGPFTSVKATATHLKAALTIVVTAQLDEYADGASVERALDGLRDQLSTAFPDQGVTARVLLTQPRSPRSARPSSASVRVPETATRS